MSGKKYFTNHTNFDINVTLLIRQGDNVGAPSLEQYFTLLAKEKSKQVTYGNDQNIYLNGLVFEWKDDSSQSMQTFRQEVTARGGKPTFDWDLNTHSSIAVNNVKNMDLSCTN